MLNGFEKSLYVFIILYNSWVSRGLERFRVLASGRVCGRARGKRSYSKPLLTQELDAVYLPLP